MKKLNITFCSFPDYSGNAKALYLFMSKKYGNLFNYNWVVTEQKSYEELSKKGIKTFIMGGKNYKEVFNSDVFFTTHANLTGCKSDKALYVELWHAVSPKNIGFMCKNITKDDENWYDDISEKIDYFIVPSEFWIPIFSARFHVKPERILPLGMPLLTLFKKNKKVFLNKLNIDISKYKKIIYYFPTFRNGCGREDGTLQKNLLNMNSYDEKKLYDYLEKNQYLLLIKNHPSEKKPIHIKSENNIKIIDDNELSEKGLSVYDILNCADLIASDYSSISLFAYYLAIPSVSLVADFKTYDINRGIIFGSIEYWNNCVTTLKEFINYIELPVNKKTEKILEKKELYFGKLKNDGCANICNYFFYKDGSINSKVKYYYSELKHLENQLINTQKHIETQKSKLVNLQKDIEAKTNQIALIETEFNKSRNELDEIYNSRMWKFVKIIRKIIK